MCKCKHVFWLLCWILATKKEEQLSAHIDTLWYRRAEDGRGWGGGGHSPFLRRLWGVLVLARAADEVSDLIEVGVLFVIQDGAAAVQFRARGGQGSAWERATRQHLTGPLSESTGSPILMEAHFTYNIRRLCSLYSIWGTGCIQWLSFSVLCRSVAWCCSAVPCYSIVIGKVQSL